MSTHKHIDRICAGIIILCILLTALFMNGEALGLQKINRQYGYENRLFDTDRVHTLSIVMDDWDSFLDTCESEEYSLCNVVIDGESINNVAIRGKGNTSLSNVSTLGSDRYSFKIEFDHYDSGKSYYGLDKLSLNNIIQDNTYMKDYLTYRMMNAFGVDSPLCSYVYITVNGEDWGLYLAVEGVEDAFLRRNYGNADGELYKPDSLSFGGGRGNGKDFDMEDFMENLGDFEMEDVPTGTESGETEGRSRGFGGFGGGEGGTPPGDFSDFSGFGGFDGEAPDMELPTDIELPEVMGQAAGFGGGMGSSDVKLSYIDDDPSSYSSIFNNAKTDITTADKNRLIASLKTLSAYEDIESVVDTEEVLRYFVVHNFVVNGDSYTGSMIHNYYLYEEDGIMRMIPWDYNLAYGTFSGGAASDAVNDPIDDVLDDRPMQAWIFSDESYVNRYHALYAEFLDSVDIQAMIAEADALISDYVERDPTKFCTVEEYETGVETLKSFCRLRVDSVSGQLEGSIPSTSALQLEDSASLVAADGLNLSDMGTMGSGMGGGGNASFGSFSKTRGDNVNLPSEETEEGDSNALSDDFGGGDGNTPPGGFGGGNGNTPPGGFNGGNGFGMQPGNMARPEGGTQTDTEQLPNETENGQWADTENMQKGDRSPEMNLPDGAASGNIDSTGYVCTLLGGSILLLLVGLLVAWKYRK